jgi:predicted Rossmann-fold nucleotide-binding protein
MRTVRELGYRLASAGIGIVYFGGGQFGLMGALIEGSLAGGGDIVGVIPEFPLAKERAHNDVRTEVRIVSSMHERLERVHLGLVRGPIVLLNEASLF